MDEKCRICLQNFSLDSLEILNLEIFKNITGFEVLPTEPQQTCRNCGKDLMYFHAFKEKCREAEMILKEIKVEEEEIDTFEEAHHSDHSSEKTTDLKCEYCEKTFKSTKDLSTHCKRLHKKEAPHECVCGKKFFHFIELNKHGLSCSKTVRDTVKKDTGKGKSTKKELEKSICCFCGKIISQQYLDRHIKDVHERFDSVEYTCDLCSEKYKTKVGILTHLKRKHLNCSYECHFCKEIFPSYGIRRTHEVRFHTFNFKYQCNLCEHKFIARRDLVKHRVTHTGEKNFKCDICGLHVSRKSVLDLHKATHSDSRPFSCGLCSAAFKTKKALRSHKNIHEERKYECPVCNQKFLVNQAMRQHCFKKHPGFELPPPGTIMNKSAIKRITEVSEKYNVQVELVKKLPKSDIMETAEVVNFDVTTHPDLQTKQIVNLKQEYSIETPILIQTYDDIDAAMIHE